MLDKIIQGIEQINIPTLLVLIALALLMLVVYRLHKGPDKFSFTDLLVDPETGKASIGRYASTGAWHASTIFIAYDTLVSGELNILALGMYLTTWAGLKGAETWIRDMPHTESTKKSTITEDRSSITESHG